MSQLPCPCCGFLTFETSYGSFAICPVCNWEDDGVQLANPTSRGGANGDSLSEAQVRVLQRYPVGVEFAAGHPRSPHWRPLAALEIAAGKVANVNGPWSRRGICAESDAYWRVALPSSDSKR